MKKAVILCMLIMLVIPPSVFAEPLKGYEPYEEGEFPLWTYKLRRAETLFFGSMVLTLPVAAIIYSVARRANMIPDPTSDVQNMLIQASIAASLSLGIAAIDYILGEVGGT